MYNPFTLLDIQNIIDLNHYVKFQTYFITFIYAYKMIKSVT